MRFTLATVGRKTPFKRKKPAAGPGSGRGGRLSHWTVVEQVLRKVKICLQSYQRTQSGVKAEHLPTPVQQPEPSAGSDEQAGVELSNDLNKTLKD